MATKKRGRPSSHKKTQAAAKATRQLHSVIWFAVAIFLMFVVFIKGEHIWTIMHDFMFRLFGITAYFYPFLLGAVAIIFATDKLSSNINAKIIESIVLVVLIGAFIDVCSTPKDQFLKSSGDLLWASQVERGKESTCQCRRHGRLGFNP